MIVIDRAIPPVALLPDIACRPDDNPAFFPEDLSGRNRHRAALRARELCGRCPHQQECLEWALETRQRYGFWGGASPGEREALRRRKSSQPLQLPRTV